MITISWHLLLFIVVAIIGFFYVMTLDDKDMFLGSDRDWGCLIYLVIFIIALLIYGGKNI